MNDVIQPDSVRATRWSAFARIGRLARKELREILRDRRTIITLIAMPILLYPIMSVVFLQFTLASKLTAKPDVEYYRVGALSDAEARAFQRRFDEGQRAWRRKLGEEVDGPKTREKAHSLPHLVWQIDDRRLTTEQERAAALAELIELLHDGKLDLIVTIPDLDPEDSAPNQRAPRADRFLRCKIYALPNNPLAQAGLAHINTVFAAADAENLKARLDVPGKAPIMAFSLEPITLETDTGDGTVSLAALVPLILILMTITGAVYPAIDLTAGERERGTLEILVAAPVPRFELLTAKYISVWTVAVLTAVVNLVCMTITIQWSGVSAMLPGLQGLSFVLILQVFALLLLFAAFFSAVLLCLTSFARSFKEAQAYLIPLMLASLAPGIMAMMPGLKLDGVLTVLPLVNIVLMARDLFDAGVDPVHGTIVVLTTLMYAVAALSLAARVFGAESVLYSEQSSWADLLRRPEAPQKAASISAMLWCLALMVPIQFGLFALIRNIGPMTPAAGVIAALAVNLLLFGLLPALFAYLGRVELRSGLGLAMPRPAALLAGLLLGLSLWPLELKALQQSGISQALEERFGSVLESFRAAQRSLGVGVFAVVIVPAILEEIFFRGLLFQAVKRWCGPAVTIYLTGVLFGATHVILDGALGLERLIPSMALGLILGAVCWYSDSLWPALIQHVCHNTILLAVGLGDSGSTTEIRWQWLSGGAFGGMLGAALLWSWGRPAAPPTATE